MTRKTVNFSVLLLFVCGVVFAPGVFQTGHSVLAVTGGDRLQPLGGGKYLTSDVKTMSAQGLSKLRISGPMNIGGHLVLNAAQTDSVRVEISKVLRVDSRLIAEELDDEIRVGFRQVGTALRLDILTPDNARWEGSDWGISLNLTITLPEGWDLDFDIRHFDCDLQGPFRRVLLSTEFGRVKVRDVTELADITGNYTGIEITDVRGRISARTTYADLSLQRALPDVEQAVRLSNISGPITVTDLAGAVFAETQYAPVVLERMSFVGSTSRIRGEWSPVSIDILEFGDAKLEVETSNKPVTIRVPGYLSARLSLHTGVRGTIHTSGIDIQTHPDLLGRGRLEGVCGTGKGIIDVAVSGSAVINLTNRDL